MKFNPRVHYKRWNSRPREMPVGNRLRSSTPDCGLLWVHLRLSLGPSLPGGFHPGPQNMAERSEYPLIFQPACLLSVFGSAGTF